MFTDDFHRMQATGLCQQDLAISPLLHQSFFPQFFQHSVHRSRADVQFQGEFIRAGRSLPTFGQGPKSEQGLQVIFFRCGEHAGKLNIKAQNLNKKS